MTIPRPAGQHAEQMLEPGGWPSINEEMIYGRALELHHVLSKVSDLTGTCSSQKAEVFDSGGWSGGAADAANNRIDSHIAELGAVQDTLTSAIAWHNRVAALSVQAKSNISDNVEQAQREIIGLQHDSRLSEDQRREAINRILTGTYEMNVATVNDVANQILGSASWDAWQDDERAAGRRATQTTQSATSGPASLAAVGEPTYPLPGGSAQRNSPATGDGHHSALITQREANPHNESDSVPARDSEHPAPAEEEPVPQGDVITEGPAEFPATTPATASVAAASASESNPLRVAPAAASVRPIAATPSGPDQSHPGRAEDGAGVLAPCAAMPSVADAGSGPATGKAPLGAPPAARVVAPESRAMSPRPIVATSLANPSAASAAAEFIPVSPSLAARDAASSAATADALRRSYGGADPLHTARRLAAALNAPDSDGADDLEFFWITAVTTDATIVVANSYGLGYIPGGVQLPEGVELASADDTVPIVLRARSATHPLLAVQDWAAHHDKALRAVVGTKEQLADSTPGAVKVFLQPEDIPDSGKMTGRSRLEVVDPGAAALMAATPDMRLYGLLPPAPVQAKAPSDLRNELWFELFKPMLSDSAGREAAHLKAFHKYGVNARDIALYEAHMAADATTRRAAAAEWLYWRHTTELVNGALAAIVNKKLAPVDA